MSKRPNYLSVFALICVLTTLVAGDARATGSNDPAVHEWKFRVFLDDREIGFHDYRIRHDGAVRRVETEASFDVRFLFFNAYSYRHRNVETWRANCLTNIEAFTDANGKELKVRGGASDDGFVVDAGAGDESLPECVMSFAYWNPEFLRATRLLNAQTGEFESVSVRDAGADTVRVEDQPIAAQRYEIAVKGRTITVWYTADDQRWLALESPAKGGRIIRYEAVRLPPASSRFTASVNGVLDNEG